MLSVTITPKFHVLGHATVPLMVPVGVSRTRPPGSEAGLMNHWYGGAPPEAASVVEYGLFTTGFGSDVVVMVNGAGDITSTNDLVAFAELASLTPIVNVKVP